MTVSGVLLMTYGSPSSLDDLPRYLAAVRGGRPAEPELVAEMRRRYAHIGGSPLLRITAEQAAALEARLGAGWKVASGMRFSDPSVEAGLRALSVAGVRQVATIVLSPQWSDLLMGGYRRAVEAALEAIGAEASAGAPAAAPTVRFAGAWHLEPAFVDGLAAGLAAAIATLPAGEQPSVPVLLSAHSLPRRVADEEPDYLEQLRATAEAVAARAGLADGRWRFCWQSAGHSPGEWMRPDLVELFPELRAAGHRSVVVAPIQFLSDHLEVLYDLDVAARAQADEAGLRYLRVPSLNAAPPLIEALASVARRTLAAADAAA
ncbi:MAG TPA: ferrochelatase [Candidatus Limnocylindrales bacterium]|nr:ferrochelatase [Candidatus Limnocylindrales bacterium]